MDTVALLGRLLISLAFVLGLMWLLARRAKKGGRGLRGGGGKLVDVLGRQQLGRNSSVAVVRVMDQALILGVTDGAVSVIGQTDLAAVEAQLEEQSPKRAARAPRASRPARTPKRRAVALTTATAVTNDALVDAVAPKRGRLAGSALSPDTWRQTLNSLRDLTARTR